MNRVHADLPVAVALPRPDAEVTGRSIGQQAWRHDCNKLLYPCGIIGGLCSLRPEEELPTDFTASGVPQGIGAESLRHLVFPVLIQKVGKDSIRGTATFPPIHGM